MAERSPEQKAREQIPRFLWFGTVGVGLLGAGLMAFWLAWGFLRRDDWYYGIAFLVAGLACAAGGAAVWWWGNWMQKAAQRPTPWLDRREWAKGEIAAVGNATSALGLGSLGIVVSGLALFLFVSNFKDYVQTGLKWGALLFGVVFSAAAVYSAWLRRKFGKSFFRLKTLPGVVGGTLEGTICIGASFPPSTTFQVQLQCLKLEYRASDERTVGKVLWESQQAVQWVRGKTANSSNVPVKFLIPHGCPESADPLSFSKQILWQLAVAARLPGLDYNAIFEVPVYNVRAGSRLSEEM